MARYLNKTGLELSWDRVQQLVQECSCNCDETIYADILPMTQGYFLNKTYMEIFNAIENGRKVVVRDPSSMSASQTYAGYFNILAVYKSALNGSLMLSFLDNTGSITTMSADGMENFPYATYTAPTE